MSGTPAPPPPPNPYTRADGMRTRMRNAAEYAYTIGGDTYATFTGGASRDAERAAKSRCGKFFMRHVRARYVLAVVLLCVVGAVAVAVPTAVLRASYAWFQRGAEDGVGEWGTTKLVRADSTVVLHVVEPSARISTTAQLRHLYDKVMNASTVDVSTGDVTRAYVEWQPYDDAPRANLTLDGMRALMHADCDADCLCAAYFHYGVERNAVYVSSAGLAAQQRAGALVALDEPVLGGDGDGDDGVVLYAPRIVSEDDSEQKEVQHQCDVHALMRAAARDGPDRVLAEDRAAEWMERNVSALIEYTAYNAKRRRRRVYLPLFACLKHCVGLLARH